MKIQNLELHCRIEGSGPVMVLLHGWGIDMQMMQFIQTAFHSRFTVINLDLPGFGKSEEPKTVWDIEQYAKLIHTLLQEQGFDNPVLVAHSFGARIAFRYGALYPTKAVIATGAAGLRPRNHYINDLKIALHKLRKKVFHTGNKGSKDYQNASQIMKGVMIEALKQPLSKEQLRQVHCPVLLVFGEYDEQTPLYMGKKLAKELPNATLVLFEEDDHFAYFHQGARFIRVMQYYLEGIYETHSH